MKILGIVGSMRKKNTDLLVKTVLKSARKVKPEIQSEVIQISEVNIEPCRACYDLCSKKPYQCVIKDDLSIIFEKMKESSALVIGSPLYFKIPSRLTALIERLASLAYFYDWRGFKKPHPLNDKPCGLVAVCGSDDPRPVLEELFNFALNLRMNPITLKSYPYLGVGGRGKIKEDKYLNPLKNAKLLGQLLAEALEKKKSF
uniref:Flavodoxin family protein n=1 Tax=candidate division WOR-3 bacterium TaxID=2052148 RepID=A0A7C3UNY4_UNCW3